MDSILNSPGLIIGLFIGIVFAIGAMFKSRPFLAIIAGFSLTLAGLIAAFYFVPGFAEEIAHTLQVPQSAALMEHIKFSSIASAVVGLITGIMAFAARSGDRRRAARLAAKQ